MAEKPRYPLPQLPPRPLGFAAPVNDLPIPGTFIPQPPPRKTIDEIMRGLSYGISQDIGQAGSSVARALMTPGNAMRGDYNEVSIYPSGYVSPVSEALIQDASNMAGVVSLGSLPAPKPSSALTAGFSDWFRGSKVVDQSGAPLTVYHGTTAPDFTTFKSKDGAIYFSTDPKVALGAERGYIDPADFPGLNLPSQIPEGLRVIPVNLSIKNPATLEDIKRVAPNARSIRDAVPALKAAGYDGYMSGYEIIAFEPTQIKSIFNNGQYNPNDPNIMRSAGVPIVQEEKPRR